MSGTSSGPAAVYLPMKRLLPVLALVALLLPGAARAAACSPLNCAPSQFALAHGTLLGFRTAALRPVKVVDLRTGAAQVHAARRVRGRRRARPPCGQAARLVRREHRRANAQRVALRAPIRLAGVSQDGSRAVGFRLAPDAATTVVIAAPSGTRELVLPGRQWDFDALRGDKLFLIHYLSGGGYQVRLLDLATGKLAASAAQGPARVRDDLGLALRASRLVRTGGTCSRSTSARTAAR